MENIFINCLAARHEVMEDHENFSVNKNKNKK